MGTNKRAGKAETERSVRSDSKKAAPANGRTPALEPDLAARSRAQVASKTAPREASEIPWGYGVDRVKAMAVDPERLFVYWEVTDAAIDAARKRLGASGADAAFVLRVYDITGRIFDGTNAHGWVDHPVARDDRRWFLDVGNPSSVAVVEIGLRSGEGGFTRIARSGRVEFPRRGDPSAESPRWLTVRLRDGKPEPRNARHEFRIEGHGAEAPVPALEAGPQPVGFGDDSRSHDFETGAEIVPGWTERVPAQTVTEESRVFRTEGDWTATSWEAGPFSTEVEASLRWAERFAGGTRVYRQGPETHVVHGPWEVVIRGLGAQRRRVVLARWEMQRSWITEEGRELRQDDPVGRMPAPGSSAGFGRGASERRWQVGSELRLAGASELIYLGASERRLGGASEYRYRGASEWLVRGASERRIGGASERVLRGASERRLHGASERRLGGASDRVLGGASEKRTRNTRRGAYPSAAGDKEEG